MRKFFRYLVFVVVLFEVSFASAGSYEDFFSAIERDNSQKVSTLLERGFDPNTVNPKGQYGLILAMRVPAPRVIDVLLASPSLQIEVRTAQDESPLMLAALSGFKEICAKLIARDADVNKPGWTPLHYAATGGHTEIMRMLLEHHAYIDAASPNGSTPLMMAAMYSSSDAVKVLLDAGADSTLKNSLGLTALDFATKAQKRQSIELIAASIRAKLSPGTW